MALYSDALESIVNVIASGAAFYAIQVSHRPADQQHPFGHHKAEYFSAVLEGVLIVVAALLIVVEVWRAWHVAAALEQPWSGLAINGFAALVNLVWAMVLIRTGRQARSPALVADGRHILTDVVTSIGVIAGLAGAVLTGWRLLDPLLALIVAGQYPVAGLACHRRLRAGAHGHGRRSRRDDAHPRHHLGQFQRGDGGARSEDPHRRAGDLHRIPSGRRSPT